jgi:HlyD family secretion protein
MKKIFYALGATIIVGAVLVVVRGKSLKVESALVERAEFVETLNSEAVIRSKERQILYAFASGNLEDLSYRSGDLVKKNQMLGRLVLDYSKPVLAPFDGVIAEVFRESPGPIQRGERILEIRGLSQFEIVSEILTTEAMRIREGAEARVLNWGGEEPMRARVLKVSRAGKIKISALGVEEERTEVRLQLFETPRNVKALLGDSYHVDVEIEVSREQNALNLPLGALWKQGEKWAVYTIEDGRARSKSVQVSKKNLTQALVSLGLSEGERVIMFPSDQIREGIKVEELQRKK